LIERSSPPMTIPREEARFDRGIEDKARLRHRGSGASTGQAGRTDRSANSAQMRAMARPPKPSPKPEAPNEPQPGSGREASVLL
jgi:hypothetical protein